MNDWKPAAPIASVPAGAVAVCEIDGRRVALCNVEGEIYCIDDVCTHDGASFNQAELDGDEIECPRHGARFDVRTGRALCLPAFRPVATHKTRVQDGTVEVQLG
ncbi:MAG: non-heme iron oxygenase ferredoxin subunit [Chloroflexota bacterium]